MDPIKRQYININLASLCNNTKNLPSLDIHIRIKIKSDGNHIIHEIHFRLLNDKVFFPYDSSKYDAQINNLLVKMLINCITNRILKYLQKVVLILLIIPSYYHLDLLMFFDSIL